jgi:hypothetical protein
MRVRRVRVLIYEGPQDWVVNTTDSENRFVKGRNVVSTRAPEHEPWEVRPTVETPIADKIITEYLTEVEVIG